VQVANQVLVGAPRAPVQEPARTEGYTYGVGSGFTLPPNRGKFVIQGAVRNQVVEPAINEMLARWSGCAMFQFRRMS